MTAFLPDPKFDIDDEVCVRFWSGSFTVVRKWFNTEHGWIYELRYEHTSGQQTIVRAEVVMSLRNPLETLSEV